MFRHILLATDLTEASARAHQMAAALAVRFGAQVTVLHVCEPPAFAIGATPCASVDSASSGEASDADVDQLVSELRALSIAADGVIRFGIPWQHIVDVVLKSGADLVVTGTHGRHGLAHALHGSVAERVVQESPVPVLAVPHGVAS